MYTNDQTITQRNINYRNMNNHQREPQYEHQRREQQQFATPYIYYLLIRKCSKPSIIYMLL